MYKFSLCLTKFCRHDLSHWWILRAFHHVLLSLLGLYFGYLPFRAELFPPDGLLFLTFGYGIARVCRGEGDGVGIFLARLPVGIVLHLIDEDLAVGE